MASVFNNLGIKRVMLSFLYGDGVLTDDRHLPHAYRRNPLSGLRWHRLRRLPAVQIVRQTLGH